MLWSSHAFVRVQSFLDMAVTAVQQLVGVRLPPSAMPNMFDQDVTTYTPKPLHHQHSQGLNRQNGICNPAFKIDPSYTRTRMQMLPVACATCAKERCIRLACLLRAHTQMQIHTQETGSHACCPPTRMLLSPHA